MIRALHFSSCTSALVLAKYITHTHTHTHTHRLWHRSSYPHRTVWYCFAPFTIFNTLHKYKDSPQNKLTVYIFCSWFSTLIRKFKSNSTAILTIFHSPRLLYQSVRILCYQPSCYNIFHIAIIFKFATNHILHRRWQHNTLSYTKLTTRHRYKTHKESKTKSNIRMQMEKTTAYQHKLFNRN